MRARRPAAGEQAPNDAIPLREREMRHCDLQRSDAFFEASCKPLSFKDMAGLWELVLSRALPVTDSAVSAPDEALIVTACRSCAIASEAVAVQ